MQAGCCALALEMLEEVCLLWEVLLTAAAPEEALGGVITVCCTFCGCGFWSRREKSGRSSKLSKPSNDSSMSADRKPQSSKSGTLVSTGEGSSILGLGEYTMLGSTIVATDNLLLALLVGMETSLDVLPLVAAEATSDSCGELVVTLCPDEMIG